MPVTYLKYSIKPDLRAQRFTNYLANGPLDFGISLVNLFEHKIFRVYQELKEHKLEVNNVFTVPPEPLHLHSAKLDTLVNIPVPSAHIGAHPISCRLLSKYRRTGMVGIKANRRMKDPSKYLVVHCHGGGWVSQSSRLSKILISMFP